MSLYFEHVKLLSYEHRPVFTGAGLRYRLEKNLQITGRLVDDNSYSGASTVLGKEIQVLDAASDYQEVILNGISFGTGRVESVDFEGGTLARDEDYTFSIKCFEEGDLSGAVGGVYAGLSWASPEKLETIQETLSFETDSNNDATYQHEVSVHYLNAGSVAASFTLAKALVAIFLNATSGLGAFLGSYSGLSLSRKMYSEAYNLVEGSCSFSETALIPATAFGNYSYSVNYAIATGQDGFTDVTETCSIKGLTSRPYYGALEGLDALKAGAYTRCSALHIAYAFSNVALKTTPISIGVSNDKFMGDISLKTAFSNNPKYNSSAIWEYTIETTRESDGYYSVQESGSVTGQGAFGSLARLDSAKTFFNASVSPSAAARCNTLYQNASGRSSSLTLVKQSLAENRIAGQLSYTFAYTDNSLFSAGDIKRAEYSLSVSRGVPVSQTYGLFNFKEITQSQQQTSLGQTDYSVTLRGKRGTALSTYLTTAKAFINSNLPVSSDRYISACQYSISPEANGFSLQLTILYANDNKAFDSVSLDR